MITATVYLDDRRDDRLAVRRASWRDRVTGGCEVTADLICPETQAVDGSALIDHRMRLRFADDATGRTSGPPAGIVAGVTQDNDLDSGASILRVTLQPTPEHRLTDVRSRVFAGMTVQAILTEVLTGCGLQEDTDFAFRLEGDYPAMTVAAQFGEPDLAFVRRLCELWGLLAVFEPRDPGADLLVFADDPRALAETAGRTIPYVSSGQRLGVTHLQRALNTLPRQVVLRNYVHLQPQAALEVSLAVPGGTGGRLIESDYNFRSADGDGAVLARIRVDAQTGRRLVYSGEAAGTALRAGQLCTVTGHRTWGDVRLLVAAVETVFEDSPLMHGPSAVPAATQRFTAVPLGRDGTPLRYRPERTTPKPSIRGVLHGIVEEATDRLAASLDGEGSYRVRLLTHGIERDAGCGGRTIYPAVRMAQPVGGAGSGMHFPLHPGTEVLLAFVDGDPDRPLICGAVPNTRDVSPVSRPTKTKSIVQTAAGSRLELDDGILSAGADGAVTGPGITGKLSVPYGDGRAGSYLRLGRADPREAAEAGGPPNVQGRAGWYDHTDGYRTSVTRGEHAIHNYGTYYRANHGTSALDVHGGSTFKQIEAEFDGIGGMHKVTMSLGSMVSSYTAGTSYGFFGGGVQEAVLGDSTREYIGLWYRARYGQTSSYDFGTSTRYVDGPGGGSDTVVNTGKSWDTASERRIDAAKSIVLSVRNPLDTGAAIARAEREMLYTQAWAVANVATSVAMGASVADKDLTSDALADLDTNLSLARSAKRIVTLLMLATRLYRLLRPAVTEAADLSGHGPEIRLSPAEAVIRAGPQVGVASALVEARFSASMATLSAGAAASCGWVQVTPTAVMLGFGPSSIRINAAGITMMAGPTVLKVGPAGVQSSTALQVMPVLPATPAMPPMKL